MHSSRDHPPILFSLCQYDTDGRANEAGHKGLCLSVVMTEDERIKPEFM